MSLVRRFMVGRHVRCVEGLASDDPYLTSIGWRFEPQFQALCQRVLENGAVAVDVGANIGATALIMSAYVGQGAVHAIEPGRRTFDLLQRNIAANGAANVQCHSCAIADRSGLAAFAENSAYGHLAPDGQGDTVVVRTLDEFACALDLQRLDLLKIDTEGFEPQVLAGARATIERFRPVIYCELNAWTLLAHGGSNPLTFLRDLTRDFPHVYRVKRWGSSLVLEEVSGDAAYRAAVLLHDNIVYFNALNDLVVFTDPAVMERFRGLIAPRRDGAVRHPIRRLLSAVRRRLRLRWRS